MRERTCLLFARAWDSGTFPIVVVSIVEVIVKGVERRRRRKWLICAGKVTSTSLGVSSSGPDQVLRRSGPTSFRRDFLEVP